MSGVPESLSVAELLVRLAERDAVIAQLRGQLAVAVGEIAEQSMTVLPEPGGASRCCDPSFFGSHGQAVHAA